MEKMRIITKIIDMKKDETFNQWLINNNDIPNTKEDHSGRLKVLIGDMWINLHDLPEPMLRGVIEDFTNRKK